jgi:hypothetical protein
MDFIRLVPYNDHEAIAKVASRRRRKRIKESRLQDIGNVAIRPRT